MRRLRTTDANLNQRRVLYREDPVLGQGLAYVNRISDVGTQRSRAEDACHPPLNHMNWANPTTNFNSHNFGRITAITGNMRIIQFGVKYGF